MPLINFLELSRTYRKFAKSKPRHRRDTMLAFLDAGYEASKGTLSVITTALEESGMTVSREKVYEELRMWRGLYNLLHLQNVEEREESTKRILSQKRGVLRFCLQCLVSDGIRSWEDVERIYGSHQNTAPGAALAGSPAETSGKDIAEAKPHSSFLLQMAEELVQSWRRFAESLLESVETLQLRVQRLEERAEASEQEKKMMEAAFASEAPRLAAAVEKAEQVRLASIVSNFPHYTQSGGHWTKEMPLVRHKPFDAFLLDKGTQPSERRQIAKAVRLGANYGPFHNSLRTEIWGRKDRKLPGVPPETEVWWYSRASGDLRFAWAQTGGEIHLFGIYRHKDVD